MTFKYSCFDVFDTALLRTVLAPSDVFRLVFRELAQQALIDSSLISEDDFVTARQHAETLARSEKGECRLDEVWAKLGEAIVLKDKDRGARVEEKIESDGLFANPEIFALIEAHRNKGKSIVFVSDMYLSHKFVLKQLKCSGLWKPGDRLYVSSSSRMQKSTGQLYQYIQADLEADPGCFEMTGDNFHSDFRMAKKAGWKATHYGGQRLNKYERKVLGLFSLERLSASILVGIIRRHRIVAGNDKASRFVGDFLAPCSVLWALWAIKMAESDGINTLKFAARDGYQAWMAASLLGELGLTDVRSDYVYLSRRSVYFANIKELETDLNWLTRGGSETTASEVFKFVGITQESDQRGIWGSQNLHTPLSEAEFKLLVVAIQKSSVAQCFLKRAQSQRQLLTKYFSQQGMTGNNQWALVDIGWHLNVQSEISKLLQPHTLHGYYVYLSSSRVPVTARGRARAMIPFKSADVPEAAEPEIWYNATLSEHLLGWAPHGTTLKYSETSSGEVKPILEKVQNVDSRAACRIEEISRDFIRKYGALLSIAFNTPDKCRTGFHSVSSVFLSQPERDAIIGLRTLLKGGGGIDTETDQIFLRPLGSEDFINAIKALRGKNRSRDHFGWLSGRAVLAGFWGVLSLRLLRFLRSKTANRSLG